MKPLEWIPSNRNWNAELEAVAAGFIYGIAYDLNNDQFLCGARYGLDSYDHIGIFDKQEEAKQACYEHLKSEINKLESYK